MGIVFFEHQTTLLIVLNRVFQSSSTYHIMGEDQWFQPVIRNRLPSRTIVLVNFVILYGKFYNIRQYLRRFWFSLSLDKFLDNRFNETVSAQGTRIESHKQHEWGHCGRENSPSGTEGSFDVYLDGGGEKIATIYWDCPYIGSNKIEKRYVKNGYDVSWDGFRIPSGPLGHGTINVRED